MSWAIGKKMTVIRIFNRNDCSCQLPQGRQQTLGQKQESAMGLWTLNWHFCARPLLISLGEKSLRTQESVGHVHVRVCHCEHLPCCLWTISLPILLTLHFCPVTLLIPYFTLTFFSASLTVLLVFFMYIIILGFPSYLCTLCPINVSMLTSNMRRRILRSRSLIPYLSSPLTKWHVQCSLTEGWPQAAASKGSTFTYIPKKLSWKRD